MHHKVISAAAINIDQFQIDIQKALDGGWQLLGEMKVMRAERDRDILVQQLIHPKYHGESPYG